VLIDSHCFLSNLMNFRVPQVLKDEEPLSTYKVQNGHSLHLVKGAAKPGSTPAATSSATPTSAPDAAAAAQARGVPTNLNAGLPYANNPLAQLEGAMGHGFGGGTYNPFAQMPGFDGQNLNDPNAVSPSRNNPSAGRMMD
jgi:ubiquilin